MFVGCERGAARPVLMLALLGSSAPAVNKPCCRQRCTLIQLAGSSVTACRLFCNLCHPSM